MAMTINTNISAMQVTNALNVNQTNLQNDMEQLSTGSRINTAADDPAGLAISQGLQAQIGGLNQAGQNAANGMSLIQTASGALTQVSDLLQNLNNLAVSAANDTNSTDSRTDIATEASSLVSEIARIASSTNFNGINLLNSSTALDLQVGAGSTSGTNQVQIDLSSANLTSTVNTLQGAQFQTMAQAGGTGATVLSNGGTALTITDTASTPNTYNLAFNSNGQLEAINTATGTAVGLVEDDNGNPLTEAQFASATGNKLNAASIVGDTNALATTSQTVTLAPTGGGSGLQFDTAADAETSIGVIQTAIQQVSTAQADLGASQIRLQSTQQSLAIDAQNLTAANSQISDTDMASEMAQFTKDNVLVQAGTAMLSQADQQSSLVLKLLQS